MSDCHQSTLMVFLFLFILGLIVYCATGKKEKEEMTETQQPLPCAKTMLDRHFPKGVRGIILEYNYYPGGIRKPSCFGKEERIKQRNRIMHLYRLRVTQERKQLYL